MIYSFYNPLYRPPLPGDLNTNFISWSDFLKESCPGGVNTHPTALINPNDKETETGDHKHSKREGSLWTYVTFSFEMVKSIHTIHTSIPLSTN